MARIWWVEVAGDGSAPSSLSPLEGGRERRPRLRVGRKAVVPAALPSGVSAARGTDERCVVGLRVGGGGGGRWRR